MGTALRSEQKTEFGRYLFPSSSPFEDEREKKSVVETSREGRIAIPLDFFAPFSPRPPGSSRERWTSLDLQLRTN